MVFKKMIAALDVWYGKGEMATAAVVFGTFTDTKPSAMYTATVAEPEGYVPGQFFRRRTAWSAGGAGKSVPEP
jgi:deoxyinosine 3'endonuclease (endonuclease V)